MKHALACVLLITSACTAASAPQGVSAPGAVVGALLTRPTLSGTEVYEVIERAPAHITPITAAKRDSSSH